MTTDGDPILDAGEVDVVLYGSYASLHTGKTRSYLRKKGLRFSERPPAHPRFRAHVRPTSENHRIPQIELPGGEVVQDTVEIFHVIEERFPEPPLRPSGALQEWACRVIEALVDPALVTMAWHFRWNFPDQNSVFVGREFGRSFRPRGDDDTVDHYGGVIAERMEGHRSAIGFEDRHHPVLDEIYDDLLAILERHFTDHPYLFGGHPSIADCVLMGPLFGHLARDPEPATRMKQRAPRVFRWTEHMNAPEVVMPELFDEPPVFAPDDEVPEGTRALLRLLIELAGERMAVAAARFEQWVTDHPHHPSRTPISEQADEPGFGRATTDLRGEPLHAGVPAQPLWVWQHALDFRDALGDRDRNRCDTLLADLGGEVLVSLPRPRRLTRVRNRLAVE